MAILETLVDQMNILAGMLIFVMGLFVVIMNGHIIKRIMGLNIMGAGVFYFFVSIGNLNQGIPPIIITPPSDVPYINPVPSALILTGIVVVVSITVYSLSLAIKIYQTYGTLDQAEIIKKNEERWK
jgi:multicomponent Na+:H+ antiporter subunit C